MKKIITPIVHVLFLFPMTFIAMGSIELVARHFDLVPDYIAVFRVPYVFLIIGVITISGIPLFWLANRLMRAIEKLQSTTAYDHLRQSILFYFIIAYSVGTWVFSGFKGNEDDVYFLTWSGISLVSIVMNYLFLFRKRRVNNT